MCSGGGMVITSFGPRPCPTCGGGGEVYSESDYEYDSDYSDSSSGGAASSSDSSSSYDYDSSSYDDEKSYSPAKRKKGPLSFGSILLISVGVAFLGFLVSGESGLWYGLGAFITIFAFGR